MSNEAPIDHFGGLIRASWVVGVLTALLAIIDLAFDFLATTDMLILFAISAGCVLNVAWLKHVRKRPLFAHYTEPIGGRLRRGESRHSRIFYAVSAFVTSAVIIAAAFMDASYVTVWLILVIFAGIVFTLAFTLASRSNHPER